MMSRFVLSLANSTIMWFKKVGPLSGEQVGDGTWGGLLKQEGDKAPCK